MTNAICSHCYRFHLDLERVETELEFLLEGMPHVDRDSAEGLRAYREFRRVEADLDKLEQAYYAHRDTALQHLLEDRALLN